jgi:colicin import membrane protein
VSIKQIIEMENQISQLPAELSQIAQNVSVEKRNEVQVVLNQVFNGVAKMRDQLDSVQVEDEKDKTNMKLANTIRLGVRQVRLDAEKTFDAKRAEVQQQMLSYKTEDSLWLKAKQTMQILTKEIEEQARWKEETKARFEAEQKELVIQQRMIKVSKVAPEMLRSEFENMSEESFVIFLGGITKAYNDRIEEEKKAEEERLENERKSQLNDTRTKLAMPYYDFWSEFEKTLNFGEQSEGDFNDFMDRNRKAKSDYEAKQEQIRIENERLKAEAEAKEKQLAYEKLELEQKLAIEKGKQDAALKKEREAKERLEAELRAKQDAETKAQKEKEQAEEKAKKEAAKLAKAPIKRKLYLWVESFEINRTFIDEENEVKDNITAKFEAFKNWARLEVEKI